MYTAEDGHASKPVGCRLSVIAYPILNTAVKILSRYCPDFVKYAVLDEETEPAMKPMGPG